MGRTVGVAMIVLAALPLACTGAADEVTTPGFLPATRWDHRPEASAWTEATLAALKAEGAVLVSSVPSDVASFCPGYATAAPAERRAFWAGLLSGIAGYESRWNPLARGGAGRFRGLMQISDATARANGCPTGAALLDGAANLSCAVRIMAGHVAADGAIAGGEGRGWLGLARDWLPLRRKRVRADLARFTAGQAYCQ